MIQDIVRAATVARLADLAALAQRLEALLDAHPDAPPFTLARLAIDVDGMVGMLEQHVAKVETHP